MNSRDYWDVPVVSWRKNHNWKLEARLVCCLSPSFLLSGITYFCLLRVDNLTLTAWVCLCSNATRKSAHSANADLCRALIARSLIINYLCLCLFPPNEYELLEFRVCTRLYILAPKPTEWTTPSICTNDRTADQLGALDLLPEKQRSLLCYKV